MKILIQYIKPFKGLVLLAFLLAAINQTFSLFDPMIFGKLIDEFAKNPFLDPAGNERTQAMFLKGVGNMLLLLVGTAMVSRIAKAFSRLYRECNYSKIWRCLVYRWLKAFHAIALSSF